jgi:Tfp pilus assembly protein FimV
VITVENDWIEYAPTPARRTVVRGGAVCAQRMPVATQRPRPVVAAPVVRPAAAGRRRLRLTRRGRVVLVVLPAVLALSSAFVGVSAPFAQAEPAAAPRTVVVDAGQSLWSIAERLAPGSDPRDVVVALERANGLHGGMVSAGARLVVPADLGR